ncbi:MAG: hypothetical protein ACK4SY_10170, partial [Pyrobaculum sp.]
MVDRNRAIPAPQRRHPKAADNVIVIQRPLQKVHNLPRVHKMGPHPAAIPPSSKNLKNCGYMKRAGVAERPKARA